MSKLAIRTILAGMICLPLLAAAAAPVIDVYKNDGCGCCKEWVKHLQANGFQVNVHDVDNPSEMRAKLGVPARLDSCHTGTVAGYVIEGHVPAADIKRLLATKPSAKGLAVPGMPLGAPGMEGPRREPYDVLLVRADGHAAVYQHYN